MTKLLRIFILTVALISFVVSTALAGPYSRVSEYGAELFYQNFRDLLNFYDGQCTLSSLRHVNNPEANAYVFTISRPGDNDVDFFIETTPDGYIRQLLMDTSLQNSVHIISFATVTAVHAAGFTDTEAHRLLTNKTEVSLGYGSGRHSEIYQSQYNRTVCINETSYHDRSFRLIWVLFPKDL